ncbi:MAG: Ger(x)C family spore germination protein [Herbinix sp.]|nr:Ger(x)C family spore germination protein [Herbinix sp.]
MKKLIFLLIPILLCGCTHDFNRKEIDEIDLVLVLGIDYSDGEYTLSALYSSGGGTDPEKKGSGEEKVAQGKGKSAYEALEDLKLKNKKSISLAQAGSFLIGSGAAVQGLKESLDFLSRDETIKMEGLIYVIKDMSASDFINTGIENKQTIHEDLEAIKQKQQENVTRNDNTVVNMLNDMDQTLSSVLIPYLIADKSGYVIQGYTVFDQFKLKDYLDQQTSDGVNFIKNIMRSYPIYLKDNASLLVSYTKTKLKASLKDKEITVTIKLNFETSVKEVLTDKDIFKQVELLKLTEEQNNYIKVILEKAVNYSKSKGLDILNLARLVEYQNYSQWSTIEGDWSEMISKINYEYEIKSKISKSFILGK